MDTNNPKEIADLLTQLMPKVCSGVNPSDIVVADCLPVRQGTPITDYLKGLDAERLIRVFFTPKSMAIDYLAHDRPDIDLNSVKLLEVIYPLTWECCYVLAIGSGDTDHLTDSDRQHIEAQRASNTQNAD